MTVVLIGVPSNGIPSEREGGIAVIKILYYYVQSFFVYIPGYAVIIVSLPKKFSRPALVLVSANKMSSTSGK